MSLETNARLIIETCENKGYTFRQTVIEVAKRCSTYEVRDLAVDLIVNPCPTYPSGCTCAMGASRLDVAAFVEWLCDHGYEREVVRNYVDGGDLYRVCKRAT